MHILTSTYVTYFFYAAGLDVATVRLEFHRQYEVDWTYVESVMEDLFLWYDWNTGRVICLPIRDFLEVILSNSAAVKLGVRVLPAMTNAWPSGVVDAGNRTSRDLQVCLSPRAYPVGR